MGESDRLGCNRRRRGAGYCPVMGKAIWSRNNGEEKGESHARFSYYCGSPEVISSPGDSGRKNPRRSSTVMSLSNNRRKRSTISWWVSDSGSVVIRTSMESGQVLRLVKIEHSVSIPACWCGRVFGRVKNRPHIFLGFSTQILSTDSVLRGIASCSAILIGSGRAGTNENKNDRLARSQNGTAVAGHARIVYASPGWDRSEKTWRTYPEDDSDHCGQHTPRLAELRAQIAFLAIARLSRNHPWQSVTTQR